MASERIRRRIERLLDEAEEAADRREWALVRQRAEEILAFDPGNADANGFLAAAERALATPTAASPTPVRPETLTPALSQREREEAHPISFAAGRYEVKRFLGEGGKKKVYLAHDTLLDRDVAFALIKTEGLDDAARARITREAQAMGRLGDHPHIVTVYDIGTEEGQPYLVLPLMSGGDVGDLIEKAENHQLPLDLAVRITDQLCQALDHAHAKGIIHRDVKPGNVWLASPSPQPSPRGRGSGSPLSPGGRELERGGNEAIDAVGAQHAVPPSSAADMVRPEPVEGRADTNLTIKLGDFGLAVAIDRSRLTQAGMMVGTVFYMPPEQALGGEITPRSDLYSVGCMLYEMVTGRPPFVGDDQIAIIGQHLNTPPVSPSWHRPDLSRGLEALILRLLEKDPTKRPASAGEVRQALAAIDLTPESSDVGAGLRPAPTGPITDNPLYRRTFVGREAELRQLQGAVDAAMSGQGALAMVVGEPGIGKTALVEQLATYVSLRGGRTLVGHCYEEGSLSLPYLAFVEAMRSYVLAREPDALKSDLGTGAADVARIVSEIRDRVQVELRPAGDPEDDRWRLLQAVSGFLRNAANVQPLLIVLEDLHWADRGTLDLLLHVARNLQGARLLIVGTYRDVEVDRAHPLSSALAELSRITTFNRVRLRGLTVEDVQRMLSSLATQEIQLVFAEAIHRQTEGNPLFVQEVLRYLAEEGLIAREGTRWRRTGEQPLSMAIPEGLRDVIGKRITRLSSACNVVLSVAAVIGRDFRLDVLQDVAGVKEEELFAAIEEASKAGVLEERQRTPTLVYRFAHAFFRQTLYEEAFTPRRIRTHQQVARAMEHRYAGRLEEHAVELAEHFTQSTDPEDLAKAVEYGELAAQRAMSVYAYGEAVRHLEQALNAQEVLDSSDKAKRCDLLLGLGQALFPTGEPRRVVDTVAPEAFALAEALGDNARASRACLLAYEGMHRYGAATMAGTAEYQEWAERADRYAAPGTSARVHADIALSIVKSQSLEREEAWALRRQALALARQLDDQETLFTAADRVIELAVTSLNHREAGLELADEFTQRSRQGVTARAQALLLGDSGNMFLISGQKSRAEECYRWVAELAARTQDTYLLLQPLRLEIVLATWEGRLEQAVAAGDRLIALGDELGSPIYARQFAEIYGGRALVLLGRAEEALATVGQARELAGIGGALPWNRRAGRARLLAHLVRNDEARTELAQIVQELQADVVANDDEWAAGTIMGVLETAVLTENREAAAALFDKLRSHGGLMLQTGGGVARILGQAAALLGDAAQARAFFDQSLKIADSARNRPESALTRLDLAELLLAESAKPDPLDLRSSVDVGARSPSPSPQGAETAPLRGTALGQALRAEALEHLDFAISEFREMKMQPSLERALRHRGLLKA